MHILIIDAVFNSAYEALPVMWWMSITLVSYTVLIKPAMGIAVPIRRIIMAIFNTADFFTNVAKLAECLDVYREAAEEAAEAAKAAAEVAAKTAAAKPAGHVHTFNGAMHLISIASTAVAAEAATAEAASMKKAYSSMQERVAMELVAATKAASAAVKNHYEEEESYW
jgi:hypothetical protein